jgi:hypothetical protein
VEVGFPGMPSPFVKGYVLDQTAIPADQQVTGNPELMDLSEEGMA